jgi:hypothetical protein
MSGRKQHFIPQILLRGFETAPSRKKGQTIVFKRGREPYVSAITDVGAQRDFYSGKRIGSDQTTLDDLITEYENRLGTKLQQLRSSTPDQSVNASLAAEVVTHLTVRSAFLRETFKLGAEALLEKLSSFLSDSERYQEYLGFGSDEPLSIAKDELDKALDLITPSLPIQVPRAVLRRMALFRLRESFAPSNPENPSLSITETAQAMAQSIPQSLRQGHVKALEKSLAPGKRQEALAKLQWRTVLNVFSIFPTVAQD